ncbi:MFS transporter [Spongiactinospora rosea]|uniref:MFS transporter n=1 Tax=Spongiactinospora rosea TaxID=2248750 RepID=UPI001CED4F61|nr:MFS transporter [Spongiactinospora rosea]
MPGGSGGGDPVVHQGAELVQGGLHALTGTTGEEVELQPGVRRVDQRRDAQRVRLPAWPPAWLLALLLTTFAFATDDYAIAGVLPAISAGLGVSEAAGGQLVTVFSLVFALAAPVASVVTATWPRRRLLTWALALFVAANWAAAFTTSYALLMGLRVLAALAAASVVPAVYAIAAALAPEGRQGHYLALVMGGLTGSLALGVPLGTWVGGMFGWRATFWLGGLLRLAALAAIRGVLPETPPALAMPIRERLAPLARPQVLLGLLAIVATVLGSMMMMTYLAPFLRDLAGAGPAELGWVFLLAGLAGFAGGQLGGRAGGRWGPDRALLTGVMGAAGGFWTGVAGEVGARLGVTVRTHAIGGELSDADGEFPARYGIRASGATLVRPDGVVAWRTAGAPDDPAKALAGALTAVLARWPPHFVNAVAPLPAGRA